MIGIFIVEVFLVKVFCFIGGFGFLVEFFLLEVSGSLDGFFLVFRFRVIVFFWGGEVFWIFGLGGEFLVGVLFVWGWVLVCGIFLLVSTEILLFFFLVSSFVLLIVGFIMRFGVLDFCEDDELDRL